MAPESTIHEEDVDGEVRDGLDEEVARAVNVPAWAREQEPTTPFPQE